MIIHLVCATRPNFMKVGPLYNALKKERWAYPVVVHTGQHYDLNMSDAFFKDLGLPKSYVNLNVGSGTHAEQTGRVMMAYENMLMEKRPDLVVVVGDVNSTMAAAIAATKCGVKVAHLEAGLRSFDKRMPEEINRIVTDSISDILWTPSRDADANLLKEGVSRDKIYLVGNIMIDSFEMMRARIESDTTYLSFGLRKGNYGVVTLHRPSNVDVPDSLKKLCSILGEIAKKMPIIFPIHPRTRRNMEDHNLLAGLRMSDNLLLTEPLGYVRFMNLITHCRFVITDSGGIQEETTYLGIPCLTIRENTERPITITEGTNQLCRLDDLRQKSERIIEGQVNNPNKIERWDGKTASRIVEYLKIMNN